MCKKCPHVCVCVNVYKFLAINLGPSNVIGMNSLNRCKGLDDRYFPGRGFHNHISERFSTWSVWRSGGRVTDLWGPFWVSLKVEVGQIGEEKKGNADKGIWTKCCRMLEMIRCPCQGAVTEVQGEKGKQEVKCGHMSQKKKKKKELVLYSGGKMNP